MVRAGAAQLVAHVGLTTAGTLEAGVALTQARSARYADTVGLYEALGVGLSDKL